LTIHIPPERAKFSAPSDWAIMMNSADIAKFGPSDLYYAKQEIMNSRYAIIAMLFLQIYRLFTVYVFPLSFFASKNIYDMGVVRMQEEVRLVGHIFRHSLS
jgi:hypothetical protein